MRFEDFKEGTRCWKGYKKKGMKTMFGKRVPNCVKNENASSGIFQTILVNLLQEKYPEGKFDIQGDKVTSEDGKLSVIADTAVEDGYGGVWVWDVNTGPYTGVLGNAIQQATSQLIKQQPNLKPAIFVDGDNQNPEAWSAIANKLNYTLIDEGNIEEDLRAWFGKGKKGGAGGGGWDRYNTKGERIGKCGDSKPGEGKPKCLSKSKAASLRSSGGKKAIGNAVKRKRKNDPNPDRRGKAKNVKNKVKDSIEEYGVGLITKQNTTADVKPGETKRQAAKFGNKVSKKGKPPTMNTKGRLKDNYNRDELPQIKNKQLKNIKHTLETVKVKKLIPVQEERIVENFKKQVDNIVAGEYNPIIVDTKNRIVNGHHRYTALQMLGIKEAKVARLPFTLEKILQVFEAHHFKNPKNTFLTKADTAYDFLRVGKTISNLSNAKKSDNRDEPDVMVVPFGGKKEKDHLKKGLKKSGYKTQDADKDGDDAHVDENFADGKKKGKSRPGRVKRSGASCKGSVTDLRKRAKGASGEKRAMYHWCANMKSGRSKK